MKNDRLKLELVFDRALVDGYECDILPVFARALRRSAPQWSSRVLVWSPNPREREFIDLDKEAESGSSALRSQVRNRTRWVGVLLVNTMLCLGVGRCTRRA